MFSKRAHWNAATNRLTLARHLGLGATPRLVVERALVSPDPLTREVGEDFLPSLDAPPP